MKNRAGFTLVEVLIALVLTAVLGAAFMGAFVSQSRFFDHQEKVGAARAVSRGAMNIMMSEMRMIELGGGMDDANPPTSQEITLRVPTMSGISCGGSLTFSALPSDMSAVEGIAFSGFAYREVAGNYVYVEGTVTTSPGTVSDCADAGIFPEVGTPGVLADGSVQELSTATAVAEGTPVFLYHKVTYSFAPSASVPGRTGLFRQVAGEDPEELVAPFDDTAEFRFFISDALTAVSAPPADLSTITGLEIVLDAVSERPSGDGTHQTVPLTTAVFFKNR